MSKKQKDARVKVILECTDGTGGRFSAEPKRSA